MNKNNPERGRLSRWGRNIAAMGVIIMGAMIPAGCLHAVEDGMGYDGIGDGLANPGDVPANPGQTNEFFDDAKTGEALRMVVGGELAGFALVVAGGVVFLLGRSLDGRNQEDEY